MEKNKELEFLIDSFFSKSKMFWGVGNIKQVIKDAFPFIGNMSLDELCKLDCVTLILSLFADEREPNLYDSNFLNKYFSVLLSPAEIKQVIIDKKISTDNMLRGQFLSQAIYLVLDTLKKEEVDNPILSNLLLQTYYLIGKTYIEETGQEGTLAPLKLELLRKKLQLNIDNGKIMPYK